MKAKVFFLAVLCAACFAATMHAQSEDKIAVVVSTKSDLTNVSMTVLRGLWTCERTSLPNGKHAVLFTRPANTPEHDAMLRSIYRMTEGDYKNFWVMKQVRGEPCRVTELPSKGMVNEALNAYPGALALVRLSDVTANMKLVSVDGFKPDDPRYPLR